MKKLILFSIFLLFSGIILSKNVDVQQARVIAQNFLFQETERTSAAGQIPGMNLVTTYQGDAVGDNGQPNILIYVFNRNEGDGFVIVSGDDRVIPVLGYSSSNTFSMSNIPPALQKVIESYKMQIAYAQQQDLEPTPEIEEQWYNLTENIVSPSKSISAISPLLSTKWNQSPYFNDLCPFDNSYSEYTVTGCTATAMAQIMKYWNYPATGIGFHSYDCPNYGTQTANFASTTYQWTSMPNDVYSANAAVATLMYHCGVSVDMNYGVAETGGSSAYVISSASPITNCAEYAYKTYFGYDPATIQGLQRSNYSESEWINLMKNDLNNNQPIQYAGFGSGGGHTFVCDGYDANNFFHMNWGWGGAYDGYFQLIALNPGGVGIGGGTGGFNSGQQAVIGIKPLTGGGSSASVIDMNSSITINPDPINFYNAFTVNADVINAGTSNFSGEYCAAMFDSEGTFIDFVQILSASGNPLPPGYHYNGGLDFSNDGMPAVPGDYIIGIYYRDEGGEWIQASSTSYYSAVSTSINSPYNPLEQYSEIVASPTTFVQGSAASVNVNFYNTGTSTFLGLYSAALYDLEGNFVETIGSYNETQGLPSGYVYNPPYITFNSSSIAAAPGTYILAILEKESGSSQYYFVGGSYYKTPVNIVVVEAANLEDIYEPNDNEPAAYNIPVNWNNNAALCSTTGSNNHSGNDYDYYKLTLSSGYKYVITARVHDSYNSGNGQVYSNDVIWSYNVGAGWSSTYDDIMTGNIQVNGSTVYFQVSSYFSGSTGTYLLDIKIQRTAGEGIDEMSGNVISLYPNPASRNFTIDFNQKDIMGSQWQIMNDIGQVVINGEFGLEPRPIDISGLAYGTYIFSVMIGDKRYVKKLIHTP